MRAKYQGVSLDQSSASLLLSKPGKRVASDSKQVPPFSDTSPPQAAGASAPARHARHSGSGRRGRAALAGPEGEELGLEDPRESLALWLPVFAGRGSRNLAGEVHHDAGAGGAEGGGPPPGAAQCGGSF